MGTLIEERPTTVAAEPARPAPAEVVVRVDGPRRRRSWLAGLIAVGLVALLLIGAVGFWRGWFGLDRLFGTSTVDRSAPAILHEIRDLSSYRAASADFSVVVDVEKDVSILPQFLAGSRVVYSGYGSVGAGVDLAQVDARRVTERPDGTVVITLPHARVERAVLDQGRSHVMNRDRGLLDRLGGVFVDSPTSERALERAAVTKMTRAARQSNLVERAERNTATMVERIATATGADRVEVRFR
jgi:hypothetical protein